MSGNRQVMVSAEIVREYSRFKDDYKWTIKVRNERGGFDYYGPVGRGPYTSVLSAYDAMCKALSELLPIRKKGSRI